MTRKLFKAKCIVRGVKDRHGYDMVEDGAILYEDGTVLDIAPAAALIASDPDVEVQGSDDLVVLPGFVNGHHHVGLTPLQLGSEDLALEPWLSARLSGRKIDPYLDTLYSAFEMIASGVTTVQHIHGWTAGPVEAIFATAQKILSAYRAIGMRASYSYAVRDQNRLIYDSDEALVAALPADLAPQVAAILRAQTIPFADNLALYDHLVEASRGQELTRIQLAPANLHWCSDNSLAAIEERSRRDDVPMHMHLLETAYQKEYARRRTGMTAVAHLSRLGLLSPRLTLGHGVWLNEGDIELAAAHGVCICHNCSSNFRLRSGIAPLNAFAARGMRVAVGIDEAGINDDRDMLQEMRMILNVHRVPGMDDVPPTCPQVLQMATEHGAMTTPFGAAIGRLEPGRKADFVAIDHRHALWPHQDGQIRLIDAVMRRAKTGSVRATVIGGVTVYENGRFTQVDRDQVLGEIAGLLAQPRTAEEQGMIEVARRMRGFVEGYYERYFDPGRHVPFYRQSSRD